MPRIPPRIGVRWIAARSRSRPSHGSSRQYLISTSMKRAARDVDDAEAGAVEQVGDRQRHARLHAHPPEALLAVADRLVEELDAHQGASSTVIATAASSRPISPPPFSATAIRAPSTWRGPASPRSWVTSSCTWASPVAPIGWPRGLQPAGGVDRDPPAQRRLAAMRRDATLTGCHEPEVLDLLHLADGGRVVHLGDIHIGRTEPGPLPQPQRGLTADVLRGVAAVP